jgi:LPS export ABC transporter protein LptC
MSSMNHKEIERWYRLKKLQRVSQIVIISAVLFTIVGIAVSKYVKMPVEQFSGALENAGMRIENFSYSSPGVHPWELKAVSANVAESLDSVNLTAPRVLYKGGKGGEILLTAESGKLDKNSHKVSAQGDVKVSYNDLAFSTAQIDYSDDKKLAETSSDVSLDGGDLQVTGKGLKVSIESEEIVIENDVKASIANVRIFGKHKMPL